MDRSAIHLRAKRGKSLRQIAAEVGPSPTTIARVLCEPRDRPALRRQRLDSRHLQQADQAAVQPQLTTAHRVDQVQRR